MRSFLGKDHLCGILIRISVVSGMGQETNRECLKGNLVSNYIVLTAVA